MAYQSEIILLSSPAPTDGTDTEDLSSGGNIYVGEGVNVVDEGATDASTPIYCNGDGSAIIDGFVYGFSAITFAGEANSLTTIEIGATGDVANFGDENAAVEVQTGLYHVDNAGTIQSATGVAVDLDYDGYTGHAGSGGGLFENSGLVQSAGIAVFLGDSGTIDNDAMVNLGTISGLIVDECESALTIKNTGTLENGEDDVLFAGESDGAIFLSNDGTIAGGVSLSGAGSSLTDSGKIEGAVTVDGNVDIASTGVLSTTFSSATLDETASAFEIDNAGEIEASLADAVLLSGRGAIVNSGDIDGGPNSYAIVNTTGVTTLDNSGTVAGIVEFSVDGSEVTDSGTIDGTVSVPGTVVVTHTGFISADDLFAVGLTGKAYAVNNAGQISSADSFAITIGNGSGAIVNTGVIESSGDDTIVDTSASGDDGYIYNYGLIEGPQSDDLVFDTIVESYGHAASIFNVGEIEGGSDGAGSAIFGSIETVVTLHNSGEIDGQVSLNAPGSAIFNYSRIEGSATLGGETTSGTTDFVNGVNGVVSADSQHTALTITAGLFSVVNRGEITAASSGTSTAAGVALDASGGAGGTLVNAGSIYGDGFGVDDLATSGDAYLYNLGTISALDKDAVYDGQHTTGHIVQLFNNGTISSPADAIYASSLDKEDLHNRGVVDGAVDLSASGSSIQNLGTITGSVTLGAAGDLLNDGVIDGGVTFTGASANLFNGTLGEATGVVNGAGVGSTYLAGLDNETFDFAVSGAGLVRGGAGADTFEFSPTTLTAATNIIGGVGADTIEFTTAGTIAAAAFAHVRGIAAITLANGTNNLTIGDALANSADGGVLTINGGTGDDTINVAGVSTATDHVTIYGGGGADVIKAGAAVDIFGYHAVSDSTGTGYDTISGVNFSHDYFDVSAAAGAILAINAAVKTGTLSSGADFNSDLAAAIGSAELGASNAVLFTPNAGTLAGETFLIIDANHTAGYVANADLVLNVTGATGTLTTTNFV